VKGISAALILAIGKRAASPYDGSSRHAMFPFIHKSTFHFLLSFPISPDENLFPLRKKFSPYENNFS